jgi:hypothetical protein
LLSQILHPSIPTNTRKQQRLCLHSSITSSIIREICHLLDTLSRSNEPMSIGWCTKSVHVSHAVRSRQETKYSPALQDRSMQRTRPPCFIDPKHLRKRSA